MATQKPLETIKDHEERIKALEIAAFGILFVLTVWENIRFAGRAMKKAKETVSIGHALLKEIDGFDK